jgi:hypothetical protein
MQAASFGFTVNGRAIRVAANTPRQSASRGSPHGSPDDRRVRRAKPAAPTAASPSPPTGRAARLSRAGRADLGQGIARKPRALVAEIATASTAISVTAAVRSAMLRAVALAPAGCARGRPGEWVGLARPPPLLERNLGLDRRARLVAAGLVLVSTSRSRSAREC